MLSKLEEIYWRMENEEGYLDNVTKEFIDFLNKKEIENEKKKGKNDK